MNKAHLHAIGFGILGALVLEMFGRPRAAKVNLPLLGRMPTLAQGDEKVGLLEGLTSGGGFLGGGAPAAPAAQ